MDESSLNETTSSLNRFYGDEAFGCENSFGYVMRRIINAMSQEIDCEFSGDQLTNAQWMPLLKLHQGVASTVADLARECDMDAGATTRLLDRIESKGLCRRLRSTIDRRVVNIELTDAGRAVAKTIPVVLRKVQDIHLEGFSLEELKMFMSLLNRLLNNARTLQTARKNK